MNVLKIFRERRGLSVKDLSIKAYVSKATINALERGNHVTVNTVELLADALHLNKNAREVLFMSCGYVESKEWGVRMFAVLLLAGFPQVEINRAISGILNQDHLESCPMCGGYSIMTGRVIKCQGRCSTVFQFDDRLSEQEIVNAWNGKNRTCTVYCE